MFGNTLPLEDLDGGDRTLVKINQDNFSSKYLLKNGDKDYAISISHSSRIDSKRKVPVERHSVEVLRTDYNADPTLPANIIKAYCVIENDVGNTVSDVVMVSNALRLLLATTEFQESLVGWQS